MLNNVNLEALGNYVDVIIDFSDQEDKSIKGDIPSKMKKLSHNQKSLVRQ